MTLKNIGLIIVGAGPVMRKKAAQYALIGCALISIPILLAIILQSEVRRVPAHQSDWLARTTNNVQADDAGNITTQRYDNARTGANLSEKILNTSNIAASRFGKLFTRAVDDAVYAQPLYLRNVAVPESSFESVLPAGLARLISEALAALHLRRPHNVLYVATVNNSVYAFDADDPGAAAPLWYVNLTGNHSGARPVKSTDVGQYCGAYPDFRENIGIVGTPVIDATSQTLYVVSRTQRNGRFVQRLHALDAATGTERRHSPVAIKAQVRGTGAGSVNDVLRFNSQIQNQRGALLLANGVVYITWGSHCDTGPYHGWIMGYDASTLSQVFAKVVTPNGEGGGIWQSGAGASADEAGNIYLATGNGTVSAPNGGQDYGNAVLKLSRTGEILDWFIPSNFDTLNLSDGDFGTTGVVPIPGTDLLASGSKEGKLYLLDRKQLGHLQGSDGQSAKSLQVGPGWLLGTPTYWNGQGKPYVYVWCSGSPGRRFRLDAPELAGVSNGQTPKDANSSGLATKKPAADNGSNMGSVETVLTDVSSTKMLGNHIPGGMLSISANGTTEGSGVLWSSLGLGSTFMGPIVPGVLRAFDAGDLSHELWNSQDNPTRDGFGDFAKFNTPVVANGKVYLATFSHQVAVFGLLPVDGGPLTVNAGADPVRGDTAKFFGAVTDAGVANSPAAATVTWVQVTGPGRATIENPHARETKVTFPMPGNFLLRFAASNGKLGADSDVAVNVPVAETGLVGHWDFQESSGDEIKDSSGNRNDGVIVPAGAPEPTRGTGEFAGSVSVGPDTHVRIPATASLNSLTREITVAAHVYPRRLVPTHYAAVVQRQWREAIHPDLFYLGYGPSNGSLQYKWHVGLVGTEVDLFRLPVGHAKPKVGQWVHLVGTYDGKTGKASLYVDGELIGSQTQEGRIRLDSQSLNRPLVIGAEINGPSIDAFSNAFDGYVDDVRIYDRALSDEEVRALAEQDKRQSPR